MRPAARRPTRRAPAKAKPVGHVALTEDAARAMVDAARICFEVPGPPVPCARARVSIKKRKAADGTERTFAMAFTPARTRSFEREVGIYALNAVNRCRAWRKDAPAYRLTIVFFRDTLRGDWDNLGKGVADGMNGIVYTDDRQVVEAHVSLRLDRERPRTVVEVVMLEHPTR